MTTKMEKAEERIGHIKDKIMENTEAEKKREINILNHECRHTELSNSMKHNIISHHRSPLRRRVGRGHKVYLSKL